MVMPQPSKFNQGPEENEQRKKQRLKTPSPVPSTTKTANTTSIKNQSVLNTEQNMSRNQDSTFLSVNLTTPNGKEAKPKNSETTNGANVRRYD